MKVKLNWNDGTSSFMYGEYSEENIDLIYEIMKRTPSKRLYRFGTRFDLVKSVEVIK